MLQGILGNIYYCNTKRVPEEKDASAGPEAGTEETQHKASLKTVTTAIQLSRNAPVESGVSGERQATNPRETLVKDILGHKNAIENSRFDISGLSKSQKALLMFAEFKLGSGDIRNETTQNDIRQTAAYALVALAYGRWGVMGEENTTPISALLIYPACIYRLSFWKPKDPFENPLGVHMKVESTDDLSLMEAVLVKYLMKYQEDCEKFAKLNRTQSFIDPIQWSPINFPFEELGGQRFARSPSFGFLFYSSLQKVRDFVDRLKQKTFPAQLPDLDSGKRIIVKVVSAILVSNHEICSFVVRSILSDEAERQTEAETKAVKAELELLKEKLRALTVSAAVKTMESLESDAVTNTGSVYAALQICDLFAYYSFNVADDPGSDITQAV